MADDLSTDRHPSITLRHLSPTFVLALDRMVGEAKHETGGYAEATVRFERGAARYLGWHQRWLPEQLRQWWQQGNVPANQPPTN